MSLSCSVVHIKSEILIQPAEKAAMLGTKTKASPTRCAYDPHASELKMQAIAMMTSTRIGSFVYKTPFTPSNVNRYCVILMDVAIRPLSQSSVSCELTVVAKKMAKSSLGMCIQSRATLNFT